MIGLVGLIVAMIINLYLAERPDGRWRSAPSAF